MTKIKFGTDGWRAIIAKDFTVENVARVSEATAIWLKKNFKEPSVVVGHDCRFAGELFAETVAKVLGHHGIHVFLAKNFVSTPMISLGTLRKKASLGIIITASHNPPSYNGFKLKGHFGGPLLPDKIQEIEDIIPERCPIDTEKMAISDLMKSKLLEYVDLETMYCDHVKANFDLDAINKSGLNLAYDAMYGAGQNVIKRLFPEVETLHCEYNPSFMGQAPEPIHKNLLEFSKYIKDAKGDIACGLATDGDADRIGLYDSDGNFVDSHHIILLLIKYMVEQKKQKGKVVTAFSVTPRVKRMCEHFKLEQQTVKIGFKYIAGIMTTEDVLLGGEESGGIAVKGHIPERDGIWMGLIIWEYMAKSGKTLKQLIKEVYEITGSFAFERYDLHLKEELKNSIVADCKAGKMKSFGKYKVERMEDTDGWKYFFNNDEWLMIRASGTEPVLRTYAESSSKTNAFAILDEAKKVLLS
ncbi:MAG TPA: phosphoglucomutase/phosphomannomutase family protein [Bacteroidia bacterium]|jgi:phosphomannomutase|nr:phosphoglucomutase/phosphomannomutase family protein [Bacteroidia bacterium]